MKYKNVLEIKAWKCTECKVKEVMKSESSERKKNINTSLEGKCISVRVLHSSGSYQNNENLRNAYAVQ